MPFDVDRFGEGATLTQNRHCVGFLSPCGPPRGRCPWTTTADRRSRRRYAVPEGLRAARGHRRGRDRFFGRVGYRGATMLQIAAACGISRAGFCTTSRPRRACSRLYWRAGPGQPGESRSRRRPASMTMSGRLSDWSPSPGTIAASPTIVNLFAVLSAEAGDPAPGPRLLRRRYATLRASWRRL